MRYLELCIEHPPESRHPMHQFIIEEREYDRVQLLSYSRSREGRYVLLFHVEGPPDPYRAALERAEAIPTFEIDAYSDRAFYLYVQEEFDGAYRQFVEALTTPGIVGVMPFEIRPDGTSKGTLVGPDEAIQAAVENIPEMLGVDIRSIGEYFGDSLEPWVRLTPRQREAVTAAVDLGYYGATRDATLADVADRLDCSTGTAGELLRRAERTVMSHQVASSRL